MSQSFNESYVDVSDAGRDDNSQYAMPIQDLQGVPNFSSGSGQIFSMYLEMATEEDRKMAETWQAGADRILIFAGFCSVVVASFISVSIQDIRPNRQDTSNFYLANIYQNVANPDRSNISSTLPVSPPPFSPPAHAIWVNALWFMSLVMSLTCAAFAILLHHWARRYLAATQPHYNLRKRARIRSFFSEGVGKLFFPMAVEALPILLHVSLSLFFAGLVLFLRHVNFRIFELVLSWIGACAALYWCITLMPIFRHDSPYFTLLTPLVWLIFTSASYAMFRVLRTLTSFHHNTHRRFLFLEKKFRRSLLQGAQKTFEETALNLSPGIDVRTFMWTLDSVEENHEMERFFSGLPNFRSSEKIDNPLSGLSRKQNWEVYGKFVEFLDRTFLSDWVSESVKNWRAIICMKAIDPAEIIPAYSLILDCVTSKDRYMGLKTASFARTVRCQGHRGDQPPALFADAIVTYILASVKRRDGSWFALASDELGVPEPVLRSYASRDVSLSILTHVTRKYYHNYGRSPWSHEAFLEVLEVASKFYAQDTSPDLRHEFCGLWNQIVQEAHSTGSTWITSYILKPLRNIYTALHKDTDSAPEKFSSSTSSGDYVLKQPSSYPLCKVPGHIHDNSAYLTSSPPIVVRVIQDGANTPVSSLSSSRLPTSMISPIPSGVPAIPSSPSSSVIPIHAGVLPTEPGTPIDSGVTIAASSLREFKLGNVRTGDRAAQPSRGRYDMV